MAEARQPTAGEWSVLALLAEGPAHGWALAAALAPQGEIGVVWSLSKPLVYRTLDALVRRGYVESLGPASSTRGPSRAVVRPTRKGRAALSRWLAQPVEHIRDLRPQLVLKLVFLRRAGRDSAALLAAQGTLVEDLLRELELRLDGASTEQAILVRYRIEAARGALRFVEAERSLALDLVNT